MLNRVAPASAVTIKVMSAATFMTASPSLVAQSADRVTTMSAWWPRVATACPARPDRWR
jgi:hypothetical protein